MLLCMEHQSTRHQHTDNREGLAYVHAYLEQVNSSRIIYVQDCHCIHQLLDTRPAKQKKNVKISQSSVKLFSSVV